MEGEVTVNAFVIILALAGVMGQGPRNLEVIPAEDVAPPLVVPEGSVIAVSLIGQISTEHVEIGDNVYARTIFPVTADDQIVIPVDTYVQGRIVDAARPGRVSGKAEMTINFHTLILDTGATIPIFGSLGGIGGVADRTGEAGVTGEGSRGQDVTVVGGRSATGAGIGAIADRSARGILLGAGVGAAVGVTEVLLTRGEDLVLPPGTLIEIVLDAPLER
jgi:hypothetical protein